MNLERVKRIADAVLYEGYLLYPYRASAVKNRQRFNWGVLAPQNYCEAQKGTERWRAKTEMLFLGGADTTLDIKLRFLHLCERNIFKVDEATMELAPTERLEANGEIYQKWQEAATREFDIDGIIVSGASAAVLADINFPGDRKIDSICGEDGKTLGAIVREQESIHGKVEVSITPMFEALEDSHGLYKVSVIVTNTAALKNAEDAKRDGALLVSMASAHLILAINNGEFISLLEPQEEFREAAESCENEGLYPVLAGEAGERDCMLASPIILYDHPQIASESAGDLYDGTEIDELLTLRILTMTDEEKREVAGLEERARKLLERSENLTPEELLKMHGRLSNARPQG